MRLLTGLGLRIGSQIRNPKSEIRNRLEDNAFALLRTADGQIAQFHTSWTQWKNRFTFEVFGRDGYVCVEGLGGSYGTESLEVGRRKREGGAPDVETFEFPGPDLSWQAEWQEFTSAIREGRQPLANGEDGLQAMRLIAAIYESARTGQVVRLESG
jgi:predicted dehydrogenase